MSETTVPDFFWKFPMQRVRSSDLDAALADASTPLTILFLWGHDCPNCDIAKRAMLQAAHRFHWPEVRWLHGNVYEQPELATRFGLHGVPAFFVFRGSRKLGRITPWPGPDAFVGAIETQIEALALASADAVR
ncbi:MAG TPA: thioredoxin family protein [Dokdonella sp.]